MKLFKGLIAFQLLRKEGENGADVFDHDVVLRFPGFF